MPESVEQLLVRLRAPLIAYLARVGPSSEAEDRYGEVALRALRNPPGASVRDVSAWLFGIARHVACVPVDRIEALSNEADPRDFRLDAESAVLTQTLRSALAREESGPLLVLHHIEGVPLSRLGEEGAMAARLSRARKRIAEGLSADERATLAAFAIPVPTSRSTEIWCPRCGDATLRANLADEPENVFLACPQCAEDDLFLAEGSAARLVRGTPGVALGRFLAMTRRNLEAWAGLPSRCPSCAESRTMRTKAEGGRLFCRCAACHYQSIDNGWMVALASASGREFWRVHRRIQVVSGANHLLFASRRDGTTLRFPICAKTGIPLV